MSCPAVVRISEVHVALPSRGRDRRHGAGLLGVPQVWTGTQIRTSGPRLSRPAPSGPLSRVPRPETCGPGGQRAAWLFPPLLLGGPALPDGRKEAKVLISLTEVGAEGLAQRWFGEAGF